MKRTQQHAVFIVAAILATAAWAADTPSTTSATSATGLSALAQPAPKKDGHPAKPATAKPAVAPVTPALAAAPVKAKAPAGPPMRKFLGVDEAVVQAVHRWQQTGRAKPIVSDDGTVMFPFGQYQPYIVCAPDRVCDMALKPGEKVIGVPSAGNTQMWEIFQGESMVGDKKQIHVVVKPRDVNLNHNLIVRTDQRTYHIDLVSRADGEYMGQVAFYYPVDMAEAWGTKKEEKEAAGRKEAGNNIAELNVDMTKVDLNYIITGGDEKIRPVTVFNDGSKTFLQMPYLVNVMEAPVFVVVNKDGRKVLTNFKPIKTDTGTWLIVDRLFEQGALLLGKDGEDGIVNIKWQKGSSSAVRGWSLFGSNG